MATANVKYVPSDRVKRYVSTSPTVDSFSNAVRPFPLVTVKVFLVVSASVMV